MRFLDDCGWVVVAVALLFIGCQIIRFLIKGLV